MADDEIPYSEVPPTYIPFDAYQIVHLHRDCPVVQEILERLRKLEERQPKGDA